MRHVPIALFSLLVVLSQAVGCKKTEDEPKVDINYTGVTIPGFTLTFTTNAPQKTDLRWEFGDFGKGTKDTCTHVYKGDGNYTVKLFSKDNTLLATTIVKIDRASYRFVFGFEDKTRKWKHYWTNTGSVAGQPIDTMITYADVEGSIVNIGDTLYFAAVSRQYPCIPAHTHIKDGDLEISYMVGRFYTSFKYTKKDDKIIIIESITGTYATNTTTTHYETY